MGTDSTKKRKKFRRKYELAIIDEESFEKLFSFRLSLMNVFTVVSALSIILIFLVYLVIAYTPLKEYIIPDYPVMEERERIERNVEIVDSLEYQMRLYAQKMQILQSILNENDPSEFENIDSLVAASSNENYANITFDPSPADSMLRLEIQENEALNINYSSGSSGIRIENLFFYPPVKGVISSNYSSEHHGTDVVAAENSIIHSVLDGVVILDTWTVETGYTIIIQHSNDFLSVYKHNSKLLKKTGDRVMAGEGIALLGNTGDLTLGPHLHFELWHEGKPVNSENYIVY